MTDYKEVLKLCKAFERSDGRDKSIAQRYELVMTPHFIKRLLVIAIADSAREKASLKFMSKAYEGSKL